jgi:hypothetical protein
VAGGERDEMGEALDRHGVAVANEIGNGVAHGGDLRGGHGGKYPVARVGPAPAAIV